MTQDLCGDPGQGGAVLWGRFGMRASPYAPPNIEPLEKYTKLGAQTYNFFKC